jgi:excisionase family DNA binding protein
MQEMNVENSSARLLYSRKDAAVLLSVSLRTLDSLIASGALPCKRLGDRVLIPQSSLSSFAGDL